MQPGAWGQRGGLPAGSTRTGNEGAGAKMSRETGSVFRTSSEYPGPYVAETRPPNSGLNVFSVSIFVCIRQSVWVISFLAKCGYLHVLPLSFPLCHIHLLSHRSIHSNYVVRSVPSRLDWGGLGVGNAEGSGTPPLNQIRSKGPEWHTGSLIAFPTQP